MTGFHVDQTLNPWTSSQNFLNRNCRPMYQLQYLFKALVLIRNRNREKSCSRLACQAVSVHDLAKFAKCWNCWFHWFLWSKFTHVRNWISQRPKNKSCSLCQTLQLFFSELLHARSLAPSSTLVKHVTFKRWNTSKHGLMTYLPLTMNIKVVHNDTLNMFK